MIKILTAFTVFLLFACSQGDVYEDQSKEDCSNLHFQIGGLSTKETISLFYNTKLILRYKRDSASQSQLIRKFCIEYKNKGIVRLISKLDNDKIYLDTTLLVPKRSYGYILAAGYPLPKNWKTLYKNDSTIVLQGFGYVPVENSVRYVTINPDTARQNTVSHY